MKKKFISILLVVTVCLSLVACSDANPTANGDVVESNTTVTENGNVVSVEDGDAIIEQENTETANDDVANDEVIHEHEYVETVTVEATCTESGTATFTCSCGDTYNKEVEAKGHNFGDYVADGNASYTADGTKTAKCSSCEATDTVADEGSKLSYTYTDGEAVKYAQQTVNLRSGPSTDFDKVGSLSTNDEVKVTGTCKETGWYRIVYGDGEAYVSNKYLGDNKVEVQQPAQNTNNGGNSTGGSTNTLASHFGVTLPFTATANINLNYGTTNWTNVWNSNTSFNPDSNYICKIYSGTQVTILDLSGNKNDCMAYLTMPDGTSGWVKFSYNGTTRFVW